MAFHRLYLLCFFVNFSLILRIEAQSGVYLEAQRGGKRVGIPLCGPGTRRSRITPRVSSLFQNIRNEEEWSQDSGNSCFQKDHRHFRVIEGLF